MKKSKAVMMIVILVIVAVAGFTAYRRAHVRTAGREIGLKCLREGDNLLGLANLIQFGKVEDIPAIIPLLDDTNAHVRFTAARTLESVSGHTIAMPSGLSGDASFSNPAMNGHAFNLSNDALLAEYISSWKAWTATYKAANKAREATR